MIGVASIPLRVVDGYRLEKRCRDALVPGGTLCDERGHARQLPRFFYEVRSWPEARELELSPHFALWEFIQTDVREAEAQRGFPRYVPCAIALVAMALEHLRLEVDEPVHIAANGGYRSPRHSINRHASTHCWGSAVNIYRIGDTYIDTREEHEHFAALARATMPGVWVRPFGDGPGFTSDHLHVDFGYVVAVPHDAPGDAYNPKLACEPL